MKELITSIKNNLIWIEKHETELSTKEKEYLTANLKKLNDEIQRCMLLHMAINV